MPTAFLIHRSSDPISLLYLCAVGVAAGIVLFGHGFRLLQRRRLILDTPFSKIRSASLGMVEISGLAAGPYTMLAPITSRACYYYRTRVWEWKKGRKNQQWVKVADECMHLLFFIDDNSGLMLVDPRGADLDLHRDFEQEFCDALFTGKGPPPEGVRTFLARYGIVTNNKIKVEEFCIKPKNSLFILGTLAENPGLEVTPQAIREDPVSSSVSLGGFSLSLRKDLSGSDSSGSHGDLIPAPMATRARCSPSTVIHLSTDSAQRKTSEMTQQQKIAAALIRAGISNPIAWSTAGLSSESVSPVQVLNEPAPPTSSSEQNASNTFEPHPPVVLMKGDRHQTFLISWRSQQAVARSLEWRCALLIWGGPVLVLLSLYFFLSTRNLH